MRNLPGDTALTLASVVIAVLLVAVEGVYKYKDGRHKIEMGERKPNDTLIVHDEPQIKRKFLRVLNTDVCYPLPGNDSRKFTITSFKVNEQTPGDKGGYAYVTKGGVGKDTLCLHLKSQPNKSYHFTVDVYGLYA